DVVPDDQAIDRPVNRFHRETQTHRLAENDVVGNIENIILEDHILGRSPGLSRVDMGAWAFRQQDVVDMILADRLPDAEVSDSVGIPGSPTPWRSSTSCVGIAEGNCTLGIVSENF